MNLQIEARLNNQNAGLLPLFKNHFRRLNRAIQSKTEIGLINWLASQDSFIQAQLIIPIWKTEFILFCLIGNWFMDCLQEFSNHEINFCLLLPPALIKFIHFSNSAISWNWNELINWLRAQFKKLWQMKCGSQHAGIGACLLRLNCF